MKIGLSFLTQIRALLIQSPSPEQLAQIPAEERASQTGGGWIAQQVTEMVAQIGASFGREHNDDDTHSTIHASGTISERLRTVPMGEWIDVPLTAARFTGSGTMTWTLPVNLAQMGVAYMLVGKTMFVRWNLTGTTVGGALGLVLQIAVHDTFTPTKSTAINPFQYTDNGVLGVGQAQCVAAASGVGTVMRLVNAGTVNWQASAGLTNVQGELFFEVA